MAGFLLPRSKKDTHRITHYTPFYTPVFAVCFHILTYAKNNKTGLMLVKYTF
jgi:hypothetical protein